MPKDRERQVNPAQHQRKLEKAKQIKKARAELQAKRNEKLAHRNPERLQRQIDELKTLETSGEIKAREKAILADLERDLKAVTKAREALGQKAPQFAQQRRRDGDGPNVLGKRGRDGERKHFHNRRDSSGSDTDDSVRRIPMPEDTPPPIPREFRRNLRDTNIDHQEPDNKLPPKPATVAETKQVYESAPQLRDLRREAVGRFVPDVVRRKQEAAKGGPSGRLVEPEEMDRLEAEGYLKTNHNKPHGQVQGGSTGDAEAEAKRLAEEEARFLSELEIQEAEGDKASGQQSGQKPSRHVEIEEVEDEDM